MEKMQKTNEDAFNGWVTAYAKRVEGTEKFVYNDKVYTENELLAYYNTLKVTEADIRGYDSYFTIQLHREKFMDLQEVIDYVAKEIIDTASVIRIRHKNWLNNRDIHIENPNYVPPTNVNTGMASQFLKKKMMNRYKVCDFTRYEQGKTINCKVSGCVRCND